MVQVPYIDVHLSSIADVSEKILAQIPAHAIACANWKEFPYTPNVEVKIAHTPSHLLLHYQVREKCIRAKYTEPNAAVWTDSCVEFFISFDKKTYYNFEFNCIGTPLLRYNTAPHVGTFATLDTMRSMLTGSSLGKNAIDLKSGDFTWQLTIAIPYACFFAHNFSTLKNVPAHANFYKCGDELDEPHFLSLFPIGTPKPDFHCPPYFGELGFLLPLQDENCNCKV
jgi:hypothetical protein